MTGPARLIAFTRKLHGLGNRVRVVLGARSLARLEGREFSYVWHVGPEFGARFDELWQIDDPVIPTWWSQALSVRYPYRDHTLDWLDDEARRARVWQIRTPHALHLPAGATPWEGDLRDLRPTAEIAERVSAFHREALDGHPYMGVMIRAHAVSHDQTRRDSPVQWYIDRLREVHAAHPGLRFFISADTPEAQQQVVAQVPGSIGQRNKGGYNTREGLMSAVSDLYLLAGSVHLIGPHFSSFPELAQKLAGNELRLETSQTPPSTRLESGQVSLADDPVFPHVRHWLDLERLG